MWRAIGDRLKSGGLAIPCAKRSLWVHGETPLQFDAARPLLRAIMRDRPHVALVLTAHRRDTLDYLRSAFENDQVLPCPLNRAPVLRRYFTRLRVEYILLLEGGRSFPGGAIRLAVARNIPLSAVNRGSGAAIDDALLKAACAAPLKVRL